MDAKIIHSNCIHCDESIRFNLNEDDFALEISILNRKKEEVRTFSKQCPSCHKMSFYRSTNQQEWGNRKSANVNKVVAFTGISCLAMVLLVAVLGYFAVKGLLTIVEWLI